VSQTARLACAVIVFLGATQALACGSLVNHVDDARTKLRRAANESNFEQAIDLAQRATSALDGAAMSAMNCKCDVAYFEFETAASRARSARDSDSPDEYVDALDRAIKSFNSAIGALKACAALRTR
jgi:hypothetical protein